MEISEQKLEGPYQYKSLQPNEIRILKLHPGAVDEPIRCELFQDSVDDHVRYNALSYHWGKTPTSCTIYVNDIPVQVGKSLEQALKAVRRGVPQQPIDWGWQRVEISVESLGLKDPFKAAAAAFVNEYNGRTRDIWPAGQSPETIEHLRQDLEILDVAMKEKMQGWMQLILRLGIVALQGISNRTLGLRHMPVTFKAQQKYFIQAGVEQEEVLQQIVASSQKAQPSLKFLLDSLRPVLDVLHAEAPQKLWVDALCINQQDLIEKNHQVPLMTRIYSKAAKIVVWLGPQIIEHENSPVAVGVFKAAENVPEDDDAARSWFSDHIAQATLAAIVIFFLRPWFTRTWIIQEYIAAGSGFPRILCGDASFDARGMEWISKYAINAVQTGEGSTLQSRHISKEMSKALDHSRWLLSRRNYQEKPIMHLMRRRLLPWLAIYRNSESTDPRDKIFAFLGLLNQDASEHGMDSGYMPADRQKVCKECAQFPLDFIPDMLLVDYRVSVVDIYASLVRCTLAATKSLNILTACHDRGKDIDRTWVPDWTVPCNMTFLSKTSFAQLLPHSDLMASGNRLAEAEITPDLKYLKARGIIWAEVCFLMPLPAQNIHQYLLAPSTNLRFLLCSGTLAKAYEDKTVLRDSVRRTFGLCGPHEHDGYGDLPDMFDEWQVLVAQFYDLIEGLPKIMGDIQSRMRFPGNNWETLIWEVCNVPEPKEQGSNAEVTPSTEKSENDIESATMNFDEEQERVLKEQETSAIRSFHADCEKITLEAVSKKLFGIFWEMQTFGRRFLGGRSVIRSTEGSQIPNKFGDGFGQGPIKTKSGDLVCVILGCETPLIVRRDLESGLSEILGPCYWAGAMNGEAIAALDKGDVELTDFVFR